MREVVTTCCVRKCTLGLSVLFFAGPILAEGQVQAASDSLWRNMAPKLFIQDEACSDLDYVRTQIVFVNYVRDPKEAEVHLIISSSPTAGGGVEYTLDFKGLGEYKDISLVLRHTVNPDATEDEVRTALVRGIERGLVPFVARTELKNRLQIAFEAPAQTAAVTDPWRNWVFEVSGYAFPQGDQSWSYLYCSLNLGVNRVTEREKLNLVGGFYVTENRYVMDSSIVRAVKRNYTVSTSYLTKLSEHFAAGVAASYSNSQYGNILFGVSALPRLEYNFVPYREYARHEVYARLDPTAHYRRYYDTTVYDRTQDFLLQDVICLGTRATRRWGTVDVSATGSHYVHDFNKNRLSLDGSTTIRIVAGLSLGLGGGYSFIHDQLALRKGEATEEERLLRLKELQTGYTYYGYVNLTYTFGSIYNNVVNPIF
ncbi:MAG: hypothetical protein ABIK62_07835 [candidate division WOR-3 bacterium]